MGNIASPWRYDAAASPARAPLKHPIAYDLALRPRAAIFQCHGRLGWAFSQDSGPCRLSEETRRSDFGAVKAVVDPQETWTLPRRTAKTVRCRESKAKA